MFVGVWLTVNRVNVNKLYLTAIKVHIHYFAINRIIIHRKYDGKKLFLLFLTLGCFMKSSFVRSTRKTQIRRSSMFKHTQYRNAK